MSVFAVLSSLCAGCASSGPPTPPRPPAAEAGGVNDPVLPLSPTLNEFIKPQVTELNWYDKPDSTEWVVNPPQCQLIGETGYADQWGQSWTKYRRLVLVDNASAHPPFVDTVNEVWVEEIMVQYPSDDNAKSAYATMTSHFNSCDGHMMSSKSRLGNITPWLPKVYEFTDSKVRWENLEGGSPRWGCASEARLSGYTIVSATICTRDPGREQTVSKIADLMGDVRA
jgi:hypothetical protein